MGLSFDNNGMYVGWSDLFDYSSLENLEASEELPIPNKVRYKKSNEGIDITNFIRSINGALDKSSQIKEYARLLKFLDKSINKNTKELFINWNSEIIPEEIGRGVLNNINRHADTKLTGKKLEAAMKNSVSSRIQKVIQNSRNMDQAYTSIDGEMARIRKAAEASPKGSKATNMTMLNPLSKFLMQTSNMVGKGVIGITATGEKVFFNLSNYWNEGIRSGDEEWIENMKFQRTFSRIQGRSKGNLQSKTCTTLANANFESDEELRLRFININTIDNNLRAEMGITDLDVLTKSPKWQNYQQVLLEKVKAQQESDQFVDLNISALLSAATDNAKELILDKINAGLNLARCYIHLMMMGFNLEDVVEFMISPAVSLVNDISNANMFDEYLSRVSVNDAMKILKGEFNLDRFFPGVTEVTYQDENGDFDRKQKESTTALNNFINPKNALIGKLKQLALEELRTVKSTNPDNYLFCSQRIVDAATYRKLVQEYGEGILMAEVAKTDKKGEAASFRVVAPTQYGNKNDKIIRDFFQAKVRGLITESLQELCPYKSNYFSKLGNNIAALSDYIEMITEKIKASADNFESFYADLNEFEQVYKLADETSTLGSKLLKLNQGLPTSEHDLITLMLQLQDAFNKRLKEFSFKPTSNGDESAIIQQFKDNNPLLSNQTIQEAYALGKEFKLIEDFNIERWLYDADYRNATAKFYNIIKGTWNIFDVVDKLPHFSAIFDLLRMSMQMNNNLVRKSHVLWLAVKKMYPNNSSIDPVEFNKLVDFVDGLLMLDYLNKSDFTLPIFVGQDYFLDNFERNKATTDSFISLDSESKRASFKLRFEQMIEDLKHGSYRDIIDGQVEVINDDTLRNNEFIKNLVSDVDRSGRVFYRLNLDMQQIAATPYNAKKYQECLDAFIKLKNYKFNGRPLTDWFMLYNFVVNKNMWGSDRLTSLFGPFLNVIKDTSLVKEYFKYAGQSDWNSTTFTDENILDRIGFDEQDAWFAVAKIISENQELFETAHMIKEYKQGAVVAKERRGNTYQEVNYLDGLISSYENYAEVNLIRQADYMNYSTIQTPFANKSHSRISIITNPQSTRSLVIALNDLIRDGILQISKENC